MAITIVKVNHALHDWLFINPTAYGRFIQFIKC